MEYLYVTPCIGVCRVDKETKKCHGCDRTIEQISQWTNYSHEQRMKIMKELGYGKRRLKRRSRTNNNN